MGPFFSWVARGRGSRFDLMIPILLSIINSNIQIHCVRSKFTFLFAECMIVQQTRKKVQVSRASVCNRRLANLFSFFFERMNTQTKNSHPRSLLEKRNTQHSGFWSVYTLAQQEGDVWQQYFLCAIFFVEKGTFQFHKEDCKIDKKSYHVH